jgi:TP901 family phage tail tape measure protein
MADFEKVYSVKIQTGQSLRKVRRLDTRTKEVGQSVRKVGEEFDRQVGKRAAKAVDRLNKRVTKTKVGLRQLRGGLDKVARKLAITSAAFTGLGVVAINNSRELNKAMASVDTLLKGMGPNVHSLKKSIQQMAIDSGKSTTELAEGLYEVVSALGESTDNVDQLTVATRAAVAGNAQTIDSVKMLAAVTKGYGDVSSEAQQKVSDLAFRTVELGQTTFPELASEMGKVVPLAAALNTTQEDLFGTMATLTGVTGNTSEVTTQLASVYASFMKPSAAMKKLAKEQGFESASTMMKTLGLAKAMGVLKDATNGEADAVAKLITRKEGQLAVLALTGGQADVYREKLEAMKDAAGATDAAFKKQTEGINKQGHSWEKTKQRLVVFTQRLGDRLIPVVDRLLDRLEPLLEYLENMDEETMDSVIALGKWVAILALATKGLSGLLGVVETLGTMKNLTMGLNNVAGGIGGVGAEAVGATSKVGALLSKLGALAAAAGVGYTVGTIIDETVLAPARKRKFREQDEQDWQAEQGQMIARAGTLEEQRDALSNLQGTLEERRMDTITGGNLLEHIAASVTGGETPMQRARRVYSEQQQSIRALESSIKATEFENWLDQGSGQFGVSQAPAAPTQTVNNQITVGAPQININGAQDKTAVANEVERRLSESLTRSARTVPGIEE